MKLKAIILPIVTLTMVVLILTACSQNTVPPTGSPTQSTQVLGSSIDPDDPVFKAYLTSGRTYPRRMTSHDMTYGADNVMTSTHEQVSPDRWRYTTTLTVTNTVIVISPTVYEKQGAQWFKLSDQQAQKIWSPFPEYRQQIVDAATVVSVTTQLIGPEDLYGRFVTAYKSIWIYKDGHQSIGKYWIGADGLLYKRDIQTVYGEATDFFDYDPSIKIEAPDAVQQ